LFKYIKEKVAMPHKERLGSSAFPLAKETPQLQAADYFAYLSYAHGIEGLSKRNWRVPPTSPLNQVVQRVRGKKTDLIFFDCESLDGMLKRELTDKAYIALAKSV
jgi:hypothetical protein